MSLLHNIRERPRIGRLHALRILAYMPHVSVFAHFPPCLLSIDLLVIFAGYGGVGHPGSQVKVDVAADVGI